MMLQNYIQGIRKKMLLVDKSSKDRHVTFEYEEVETNVEEYVSITEDDIRTDVIKEKSHKRPKVKVPKNLSGLVDDENVTYLEEKRMKKIKIDHSQIVKANNEDPLQQNQRFAPDLAPDFSAIFL